GANLQSNIEITKEMNEKIYIIPPNRTRYLSEITENNRNYDKWVVSQAKVAQKLYSIYQTALTFSSNTEIELSSLDAIWDELAPSTNQNSEDVFKILKAQFEKLLLELDPKNKKLIEEIEQKFQQYKNEFYIFKVRNKELKIATHYESLSHTQVPKISTPK